ncbi:hypothetical protein P3L10_017353 [Capsicum annuum]
MWDILVIEQRQHQIKFGNSNTLASSSIVAQQSEENEHLMSADDILTTIWVNKLAMFVGKDTERGLEKRVLCKR